MAAKPFASGYILNAADVNDLTGVINRAPTAVDATGAGLQVLYEPTVAAGAMSTDRMVRITCGGDMLQNASANLNIKVRRSTVVLWETTIDFPNDADRAPWRMVIEYQNINSASVQRLGGVLFIGDQIPPAAGQGSDFPSAPAGVTNGGALTFGANDTANTAASITLGAAIGWTVASANASIRKLYAIAELL